MEPINPHWLAFFRAIRAAAVELDRAERMEETAEAQDVERRQ